MRKFNNIQTLETIRNQNSTEFENILNNLDTLVVDNNTESINNTANYQLNTTTITSPNTNTTSSITNNSSSPTNISPVNYELKQFEELRRKRKSETDSDNESKDENSDDEELKSEIGSDNEEEIDNDLSSTNEKNVNDVYKTAEDKLKDIIKKDDDEFSNYTSISLPKLSFTKEKLKTVKQEFENSIKINKEEAENVAIAKDNLKLIQHQTPLESLLTNFSNFFKNFNDFAKFLASGIRKTGILIFHGFEFLLENWQGTILGLGLIIFTIILLRGGAIQWAGSKTVSTIEWITRPRGPFNLSQSSTNPPPSIPLEIENQPKLIAETDITLKLLVIKWLKAILEKLENKSRFFIIRRSE